MQFSFFRALLFPALISFSIIIDRFNAISQSQSVSVKGVCKIAKSSVFENKGHRLSPDTGDVCGTVFTELQKKNIFRP